MTALPPAIARRKASLLPLALLLLLGSLWGFTFSLVKIAMVNGVPPFAYTFWQSLGAGTMLILVAALRGKLPPPSRRVAAYCLVTGLLGLAIPNVNGAAALRHIPAGLMAVIITLAPLATACLSQVFGLEKLGRRQVAGLVLGFLGALLIVLPRSSLPTQEMVFWAVLAMATPLCYAATNVVIARYRPAEIDSVVLAGAMLLAAASCLFPIVLLTGSWHKLWPAGPGETAVLAQMAFTAVAYFLWFETLRLAGPVFSSQVGYIVTATGLAWGMLLFGEAYSLWIWLAVLMIAAGVALVARRA